MESILWILLGFENRFSPGFSKMVGIVQTLVIAYENYETILYRDPWRVDENSIWLISFFL